MNVWAFNKAGSEEAVQLVYGSVKAGKSRFGWSQEDSHNLRLEGWTDWHSKQLFLLRIKPGDWIVHINTPEWGKCVAAQVKSEYDFDEGLSVNEGQDFRHFFEVDEKTIEFDRRDPNVLPSVNLNPRQRYHQIYAVDDFLTSLKNLNPNTPGEVKLAEGESRAEFHLKEKADRYLQDLTKLIHEMNKSKELERFMAKVFRKIPGVDEVVENGFGWGTDYGADLIVTMRSYLGNLDFTNKIVVQVKSYRGEHHDLEAVEQIKVAIKKFNASAGMIITTAQRTEALENSIQEVTDELGCPIDLLAGEDVARFVIKNASELLFKLETS